MTVYPVIHKRKMKRAKLLSINADLLLNILQGQDGTCIVQSQGIPDDAEVIGLAIDRIPNVLQLLVRSEEFPEVAEGYHYRDLDVTMSEWVPVLQPNGDLLFRLEDLSTPFRERVLAAWAKRHQLE